jgi:NADH-quinone oxidoreductase subunit N
MFSLQIDAVVPMLCVTLGALAAMGGEALRGKGPRMPVGWFGIIGLAGAAVSAVILWNPTPEAFREDFGVIVADNFGLFVTLVLAAIGILTVMFSSQVIHRDNLPAGEYYALLLFSIVGMMMMATATDLLVIFVALEVLSLAVYVLTGIRRDDQAGTEAAFKYFLLGAISSAFFLYGIAFTYGVTHSTRLSAISQYLSAQSMAGEPMVLIALGLLLVGFAFKISAVPFHMWTPDAYEGAPAIVTGFMSTGVKAAAFAAFARVFLSSFEPFRDVSAAGPGWAPIVGVIAAATMILGTVVGVAQGNLKRMLAYSSIAHGGYLLVGLAYSLTNLAALGVIAMLGARDRANDSLRDYAGLWNTNPGLAALMTVCLLSLGGLPPTAGFIGKWYIFQAAVSAGYYWLAIIGVLTSVVSVFFYLRVVVMMYMAERDGTHAPARVTGFGMVALALSIVVIFYLGILPTPVLDFAGKSIATIF